MIVYTTFQTGVWRPWGFHFPRIVAVDACLPVHADDLPPIVGLLRWCPPPRAPVEPPVGRDLGGYGWPPPPLMIFFEQVPVVHGGFFWHGW